MNQTRIIDGEEIQIYPVENGFVLSDEWGWIAGFYDSPEACEKALRLTREINGFNRLSEIVKTINHKQSRYITISDLEHKT